MDQRSGYFIYLCHMRHPLNPQCPYVLSLHLLLHQSLVLLRTSSFPMEYCIIPNILLHIRICIHSGLVSSLFFSAQQSDQYIITGHTTVLYILAFNFIGILLPFNTPFTYLHIFLQPFHTFKLSIRFNSSPISSLRMLYTLVFLSSSRFIFGINIFRLVCHLNILPVVQCLTGWQSHLRIAVLTGLLLWDVSERTSSVITRSSDSIDDHQ